MAYYRQIYTTFWTDSKVTDDFTPEDKYFYLYLLTNSRTNLCGCYEISKKQICNDTGYNTDTVTRLLERLESVHEVILYSEKTKEILLLNWHKYNWSKSDKLLKGVANEIKQIKSPEFRKKMIGILDSYSGYPIDTLSSAETYPIDTSVTVTVTDTVSVTDNNYSSLRDEIINHLNQCTGKNFRSNTAATVRMIDARLNDGYTVEDFKEVIDNKVYEWKGTEQEQYLRPETLFTPSHFESYLNQGKVKKKKTKSSGRDWDNL